MDTVVVLGPPLAGAGSVTAALRAGLDGCTIVEPDGLRAGQYPDVVVFVTSAAAPMSDGDVALLAAAAARTDAVVAAVTKIDMHRTWRTVLDINRTSSQYRAVPWVGVAADPEFGPPVIGPLVDAVRAALDDEHRRRRNLLRARAWTLRCRLAEHEREVARRAMLRAEAARRSATRVRIQQARVQLAAQARARCAAVRAEAQGEAAVVTHRGLDSFDDRTRRAVQRVADDFDDAVAQRMAEISTSAGTAAAALPPAPPLQSYLPPPHQPAHEDRLAAVLGLGFGLGVALSLGRLLAALVPVATPAVMFGCAAAGLALAGWVVRTRRLLTARATRERWVAEAAAGLRAALEERLLAAESALLEAHADVFRAAGPSGGTTADPAIDGWIRELAQVHAELGQESRLTTGVGPALIFSQDADAERPADGNNLCGRNR